LYLDYSREEGAWSPNVHGGRDNLDAVAFLQEMNATVYRRNPGVVACEGLPAPLLSPARAPAGA
ncbi:hypothetical protein ACWFQT_03050, partial [Cellulosimicrobium cellulans]